MSLRSSPGQSPDSSGIPPGLMMTQRPEVPVPDVGGRSGETRIGANDEMRHGLPSDQHEDRQDEK